ncbi:MAG: hypothetical protein GY769_11920 [bacterium]|nr:hypothetical protein [bacterium]
MRSRASFPVVQVGLLLAAGSLSGGPAAADWLVTTGGTAVETRGSWEIRGRLVVFHTADGTFASMRLSEVDLAASEARTEAVQAAAKARSQRSARKPAPALKARFVLTDKDVGHVDPATLPNPVASEDDQEAGSTTQPAATEASEGEVVGPEDNPLEVISWDAVLGAGSDGIRITGVVRNPSEFFAGDISIQVTVLDLEGGEIESRTASMEANALAPNEQGSFEVAFPEVFNVGDAVFEATSFNALVSE